MLCEPSVLCIFFFNDTATTEIYTLSLHDALPIYWGRYHQPTFAGLFDRAIGADVYQDEEIWSYLGGAPVSPTTARSEEHTSELQSPCNLVCRLLLEKKTRSPSALRLTNAVSHAHV